MKQYIYFANWKMNFSFNESVDFVKTNHDELKNISNCSDVVICPSAEAIHSVKTVLKSTSVKVGAQDCSSAAKGNFTGQVSARSLKELECSHCIIGHSERRKYNHETDEDIANKLINLIESEISPIICIGESLSEYKTNNTLKILENQLGLIIKNLKTYSSKNLTIYIAYEPIWAVGTGIVADNTHLETIFSWLKEKLCGLAQHPKFIYGGSISSENIKILKKIKIIDGFLIGGASLRFQELKKIVDLE